MAWRTISVALTASTAGYTSGLMGAARTTQRFGQQVEGVQKRTGAGWGKVAKGVGVGLGIVGAALGASLSEAIKWESAFAGVRKTVDGSEAEFKALENGLIGLANRLPQSREEIAGVAEAAGQLGIAKGDILEFTEVMVNLGTATNLSSEEAATGLAQFANIMQTSAADYERLGSTLVDLGNKGASTESDILAMSLRLAGAGQVIGLTESDVLSLSNAMASMGIQSELGGGSFSRTMLKVYSAVKEGGDKLEAFASVAGMSADEFATAFETRPAEALDAVVVGLGKAKDSGANMVEILKSLGIKGTQDLQVMLRLAGAGDLLTESLDNGTSAWEENTALADEAAERYKTAESQLKIFGNQVTDVARQVGAGLIPVMLSSLDAARDFGAFIGDVAADLGSRLAPAFADIVDAGENLADVFGAVMDVAGPVAGAMAKIVAGTIIAGFTTLAAGAEALSGFLADNESLVKAATVALIAYGGVRAFTALASGAETLALKLMYARDAMAGWKISQTIGAVAGQLKIAATGASQLATGVAGGGAMLKSGLAGAASAIGPLGIALVGIGVVGYLAFSRTEKGAKKARAEIEKMTKGLDKTSIPDLERMETQLRNLADINYDAIDQIGGIFGDTASDEYEQAADKVAASLEHVREQYGAVQDQFREDLGVEYSIEAIERFAEAADLDPNEMNTKDFVDAMVEARGAADAATPAAENMASAVETIGNEASSATDKIDSLKDVLDELIDKPKSLFDTATGFAEGIRSLSDAVIEYGFNLDGMTEAGSTVRGELSGLVDDAKASSEAMLDNGFAPEVAVEELKKAEATIRGIAEAAGVTGDPLEALLIDLGLFDDTYEAFLSASAGDAEAAIEATTQSLTDYTKLDATNYLKLDDTQASTALKVIDIGLDSYIESDPKAQAFLDISDPEARTSALNGLALTWIQSDPTAKAYFDTLNPEQKQAVLAAIAQKWRAENPTTVARLEGIDAINIALDNAARTRQARINVTMGVIQNNTGQSTGQIFGGTGGSRWGHVRAFAKGGVTAHVQHGEVYRMAERETGGEALIPRLGDKARNLSILKIAAGWSGMKVVPQRTVGYAGGGVVTPQVFPVRGGAASGRPVSFYVSVDARGVSNGADMANQIMTTFERNVPRFHKALDRYDRAVAQT